ncbi:MAG: hypothetical protein K9G59_04270 [Caulobacter sp.]|nr:hypothetical protein [Caulobacter sp.]
MKSVPTLAGAAALAAGALILASAIGAAPAQAAVTKAHCEAADAMADGVYELALKNVPRLYRTAADAAAAALAAYTRRVLSENGPYTEDGKDPADQNKAKGLCNRKGGFPPSGPWV